MGCLSCAIFFLEPSPFEGDKKDFLIILVLIITVIYTADHIFDGYKTKGTSGVLRYDLNYKYRYLLIPMCIGMTAIVVYLIYKNRDALFIENGVWLSPLIPFYFFFKLKGMFTPLQKMIVISLIVSAVVVSLYSSTNIFADILTMERTAMALLAFLNQLVLEHFEFHEEHKELHPSTEDLYLSLAKRIFIWMVILLIVSLFLNPFSWPYAFAILLTSLFLRLILKYESWFITDRRYRYWADFSFVLMWPLLKLFLFMESLIFKFI